MNGRIRSYLILGGAQGALLLVVIASVTAAAVDGEQWERRQAGGVTVVFAESDDRAAARVADIIEEREPEILDEMLLEEFGPLRVVIAESESRFAELTRGGVPDWGVGCAIARQNLIVLKSPRIIAYPLQMERVVVHELAHIATAHALGRVNAPRWFNEGVAMTVAGQWRLTQSSAMSSAVLFNGLIPLEDLEGRFPEGARDARLAYAESFRAVELLRRMTGHDRAGALVNAVRAGGTFDAALEEQTGMTRAAFYVAAEDFFRERFGIGLLLTGWNPLLLAAALLAILAVVLRVRARRQKLRQWEREELDGERAARRGNRSWQ